MNTVQTHPLVDDYLRRLHAASWVLGPDRRTELVSEIGEHIEDALRASGTSDEVAVRNVLERLGAPEEIVAAAVEGQPGAAAGGQPGAAVGPTPPRAAPAPRRVGGLEIASIVALAIGGVILPVVGVVVGVVLAWASSLWTRVDKLVATALPATFLALPALAFVTRLGGWFPARGMMPRPMSGMMLLPDRMEMLWGAGLWFGPMLGGVLAAVYLAIQAGRRARPPGS